MSDHIVPLERFHEARRVLDGRIDRTPILASSTAARVLAARGIRVADGRIYAKAEHLQKAGAFKIRGALNKMAALSAAERAAGVVTLSAGNHAQGVALAAHRSRGHAVVMMPAGAVRSKVDACRGYGAEVILFGDEIGQTWARMEEVQAERGLTFVPPFDDPLIIAGQGTIGLEILDDLARSRRSWWRESAAGRSAPGPRPRSRRRGKGCGSTAWSRSCPTRCRSPWSGTRSWPIKPVSVADGLGLAVRRRVGRWPWAALPRRDRSHRRRHDSRGHEVRSGADEAARGTGRGGGVGGGAVGHVPIHDGERVCVVFSGGNVELGRLGELLAGAAPLEIPPAVE